MEGVELQEGYCSEDLLLRVVGWKWWVTRAEKPVGWHVKPSPSNVALPIYSGISLQVSLSLLVRSDLGIKIYNVTTQLPPWCIFYRLCRPIFVPCKETKDYITIPT
jgi:hypothetical protein